MREASALLVVVAGVLGTAPSTHGSGPAQVSSARIALQRVRHARDVAVAADTIVPGSPLEAALLARPRRDRTRVVFDDGSGDSTGVSTRVRRGEVARLRRAGIDARLRRGMHMQAVVADGAVFLSDGGWTPASFVVRADVQETTIVQAMNGRPQAMQTFATRRGEALDLELAALGPCLTPMAVETRTFDADSPVLDVLDLCARRGKNVRLIVGEDSYSSGDRRAALGRLIADGVAVRTASSTERIAFGSHGWASSADAVTEDPDALEWAQALPNLSRTLAARFERDWSAGRDVRSGG